MSFASVSHLYSLQWQWLTLANIDGQWPMLGKRVRYLKGNHCMVDANTGVKRTLRQQRKRH